MKYCVAILFLLSACATLQAPPNTPIPSPSPLVSVIQTTKPVHFYIVHGFLEAQTSDQAGLHTLGQDLLKLYPTAKVDEYAQDKFDQVPYNEKECEIDAGNSWGFSAIERRLDLHPAYHVVLALGFDGVYNTINQPSQALDSDGWRLRANVGDTIVFRETDSVLHGQGIKPPNLEVGSIVHDDAQGFLAISWNRGQEYVIDSTGSDFSAHFKVLTGHPWVRGVTLNAIAQAVSNCK